MVTLYFPYQHNRGLRLDHGDFRAGSPGRLQLTATLTAVAFSDLQQ